MKSRRRRRRNETMTFNHLLRSAFRSNQNQITSYVKCAVAKSFPGHVHQAQLLARVYSTEASLQKNDSATELTDEKGYKGHDMLAPFTAGSQSTDMHPLVIERTKGCYAYDTNGKKYLDSLAGLWCRALDVTTFFTCEAYLKMNILKMLTKINMHWLADVCYKLSSDGWPVVPCFKYGFHCLLNPKQISRVS